LVESLGAPSYDGESFTFQSDKFSDFIIAYTDSRKKIDLSQYNVLYLPTGLKTVESEAFSGVAAQVIVIPEQCVSIAADAFTGCERLAYIVNYSSLTIVPPAGVEVLTEDEAQ
jgi:hypothetical protein